MVSIVSSHAGRLLQQVELTPHLSRYWLNHKRATDREGFDAAAKQVCDHYLSAFSLHQEGKQLVYTDEKTGFQNLKRKQPTRPPMLPGKVELRKNEYIRQGTLCLFIHQSGSGHRINHSPLIGTGPNRGRLCGSHPANHVRLAAELNQIEDEVEVKGESGILKSMKTRQAFLEDESHRIRFVYMPIHTSWLIRLKFDLAFWLMYKKCAE